MGKNFLTGLVFAAALFAAPGFAQEKPGADLVSLISAVRARVAEQTCKKEDPRCNLLFDTSPLHTEFITLQNLKLKFAMCPGYAPSQGISDTSPDFEQASSKFMRSIAGLLSRRGSVEVDTRSNTFIVTEVNDRLEIIMPFMRSLGDPRFTVEDVVKAFEAEAGK